jgi:Insertion element 4 transposase N-terminal
MGSGVVVRPDQVSLGVLAAAVPRDVIDVVVAACGAGDRRSGGKLPAHVVAYLTMAMCLFPDDDYEEVAARVTGSLSAWGCWDAAWSVPTASGITQARKRLGRGVMPEVFEGVAEAVATSDTRGAWLRGWRLLAIDGFEADLPGTPANAAEFGYAGPGGQPAGISQGPGGGAGRVRHARVPGCRGWRLSGRGEDHGQPALPAAAPR